MKGTLPPTGDQRTPDDDTLIARIAGQDRLALDTLYERYARVVYGLALRMLGDPEHAEDIVQETFWRVWRRGATFQAGRGPAAGWIFGIAHNLSIDELRRRRARPSPVYEAGGAPALREIVDEDMDVVGAAAESERRRLIERALGQISADQRQAIELAYFGGLSQSEIAERLQSPIGTVKTRIRLGLRHLREVLQAQNLHLEDLTE